MPQIRVSRAALFLTLHLAGVAGAAGANGPPAAARGCEEIVEGLVVGFLGDEASLKGCVRAGAAEIGDVEEAVLDIERRNAVDVALGLWKLGRALRTFPKALRACKALEVHAVQAANALAQISGPLQLAYEMGRHLLVNWRDILREVEDAISDFRAQRFEGFGVDVGTALRKLILGSGQMAMPLPVEAAKDIAGGFIEGFLSDQPDLKTCVRSGVAEFGDLRAAAIDFERRDAVDVARGLRKLADAFDGFPGTMRACKAAEGDVAQVAGALAQIRSPLKFAYEVGKHLLVNGREIFQEIKNSVVDFFARRFEAFGIDIGTALRKLLVGSSLAALAPPASAAGDIAGGVIEGFFPDEPTLKRCVKARDVELGGIQKAVRDLDGGEATSVARGLWDFGRGLQVLPAALRACASSDYHVDHLGSALAQMTRPFQFAYEAGRHLIINWHDIAQDVDDAMGHYRAGRFGGFGVGLGTALRKLAAGSQPPAADLPAEAATEIAGGLVEGFLPDQQDVKQCVKAGAAELGDVVQAVREIERRGAVDVAIGLRDLAHAVRLVPSMLRTCRVLEADVDRISSSLAQIARPSQFAFGAGEGEHLIVNWRDIGAEIDAALAAVRARRFEGFGIDLGRAFRKITIDENSALPELVV